MIIKIAITFLIITNFSLAKVFAQSVYLDQENMTVQVGPATSPGSLNNTFSEDNTINKVVDAPSSDAEEFHDQTTHFWFTPSETGGGLELLFEFQQEYDITTLHFWNYTSENYDVDFLQFTFFDASNSQVGTLSVEPELGSSPGIRAQDIPLSAPLNVKSVTVFLSGSKGEIDFQNIGFTAAVSDLLVRIERAVAVKFFSLTGLTYRIESSLDLQIWMPEEIGIIGDLSDKVYFFEAQVPKKFYRVIQELTSIRRIRKGLIFRPKS